MGCITMILFSLVVIIGLGLSLLGVQSEGAFTFTFLMLGAGIILYILADIGVFNKKDK
jgi:hypothetical protein